MRQWNSRQQREATAISWLPHAVSSPDWREFRCVQQRASSDRCLFLAIPGLWVYPCAYEGTLGLWGCHGIVRVPWGCQVLLDCDNTLELWGYHGVTYTSYYEGTMGLWGYHGIVRIPWDCEGTLGLWGYHGLVGILKDCRSKIRTSMFTVYWLTIFRPQKDSGIFVCSQNTIIFKFNWRNLMWSRHRVMQLAQDSVVQSAFVGTVMNIGFHNSPEFIDRPNNYKHLKECPLPSS
jgi:hypothetical protein